MSSVRVRFAPSPTGPLHIGGVRTALYNYLFAKKNNGKIILRIEDTDQARYVPGAEEYIINSLKWCGIEFDEGGELAGDYGPYKQSERKDIYKKYALELVESGNAYYAFDTPEELDEMRKKMKRSGVSSPQYNSITRSSMKNSLSLSKDEVRSRLESQEKHVIRIKSPRNKEIKIQDIIRGWVLVNSNNIDDKVIFKSDGMPTYHLANVVDDHLMNISHVIRGEEWLPSAPVHALLYEFLGWKKNMPKFAHLPLILRPDGNGKLSKRDGERLGFPVFPISWKNPQTKEISIGYKEEGYFSEAFINMLVFLGWNPGTSQEIFSMQELIKSFTLERVGKSGAKYDFKKTRWFNQQYLRKKSSKYLVKELEGFLKKNKLKREVSFINSVCDQIKDRAVFANDLWKEGRYYFIPPKKYDKKAVAKHCNEKTKPKIQQLKNQLVELSDFSSQEIEKTFKTYMVKNDISIGVFLPLFRVLLTGVAAGPPVFDIAELLGKKEVVKRIKNALENTDLWE